MQAKNTIRIQVFLFAFLFILLGSLFSLSVHANKLEEEGIDRNYRIAMFYPREAPFWNTFTRLMKVAANDLGIDLLLISGDGDRLLLKNKFVAAISGHNKVDAVIFNNYKDSASQFIKLANEAKVFSFLVNSAMTKEKAYEMGKPREKYPYWIGQMHPDEAGANDKIINILIDQAKKASSIRPIKVIGINGPISSGAAMMRANAVVEAVNKMEDVNLLQIVNNENWSENLATQKFQALMKRYENVQVIWAGSARMVDAIMAGQKELSIRAGKDFYTGGVGFKSSMLEGIDRQEVSVAAGGHYIEGAWALTLMFDYLTGHDFLDSGVEILTPMGIVTNENIRLYLENLTEEKWTEENLEKIDFKKYSKFYNKGLKEYSFSFDSIIEQLN